MKHHSYTSLKLILSKLFAKHETFFYMRFMILLGQRSPLITLPNQIPVPICSCLYNDFFQMVWLLILS
jgi:hypothetical protein